MLMGIAISTSRPAVSAEFWDSLPKPSGLSPAMVADFENDNFAAPAFGPEIIINGGMGTDQATAPTGWTNVTSGKEAPVVNGRVRPTANGSGTGRVYQLIQVTPGRIYRFRVRRWPGTSGNSIVYLSTTGSAGASILNIGPNGNTEYNTVYFKPNAGVTQLYILLDTLSTVNNAYAEFDDVSCQEILGGFAGEGSQLRKTTLDELYTFTCASTVERTYFDASGTLRNDLAANQPRYDWSTGKRRLLLEPMAWNSLLNSAVLVTQTRAVTAQVYTLSFYGTGSIALSGPHTANVVGTGENARTVYTFTPTAGDLVLTVTGTVTRAQLEATAFATSWIPTTGAPVQRQKEDMVLTTYGLMLHQQTVGTMRIRGRLHYVPPAAGNGRRIFGTAALTGNGGLIAETPTQAAIATVGTTYLATLGSGSWLTGYALAFAFGGGTTAASINGGTVATGNGITGITFGALGQSSGSPVNQNNFGAGRYESHVLWPQKAANADLPGLAVAA
jgi:hypothetical protein